MNDDELKALVADLKQAKDEIRSEINRLKAEEAQHVAAQNVPQEPDYSEIRNLILGTDSPFGRYQGPFEGKGKRHVK